MTNLARRLEELFTEITLEEDRPFSPVKRMFRKAAQVFEETFTSIAFAEEGEFEPALDSFNKNGGSPQTPFNRNPKTRVARLCSGRA